MKKGDVLFCFFWLVCFSALSFWAASKLKTFPHESDIIAAGV
jgi:hypothetical protein